MEISNTKKRDVFENCIKDMRIPHIYKVGNDFYYLGQMVCRICIVEEIEAYRNLMNEYNRLKSLDYDLETRDCDTLKAYYSQMITVIEVDEYDEAQYRKVAHARNDLLFNLDDVTLSELIEQYYTYKEIMDWNSGKLNRRFSYR